MKDMDYGSLPGKRGKQVNQKTKGAGVKSGLSKQTSITQENTRNETTGQRPKCKKENATGPFTFKT